MFRWAYLTLLGAVGILVGLCAVSGPVRAEGGGLIAREEVRVTAPDRQAAKALFGLENLPIVTRSEAEPPGWAVSVAGENIGHIASTWEVIRSVGYSGKPLDVLVAVASDGTIKGAQLVRHNEPILTLGLSDQDIARFVAGFAGIDLMNPDGAGSGPDMPDIISRATVSTGVIRDSILRTARLLAISRGLVPGGGLDRLSYQPMSWPELTAIGAIVEGTTTLSEARALLPEAHPPIPEGDAPFVAITLALVDPPSIGRNILGAQQFNRAMSALGPDDYLLFVGSYGLYSHRGTKWRRSGLFERLTIMQNGLAFPLTDEGYTRIDKLPANDAPAFKERSLFRVSGAGFDPVQPFQLVLTASRATAAGPDVSFEVPLEYRLPERFVQAPPPEAAPLWQRTWEEKKLAVISVAVMQVALTLILLFQEPLVHRKKLWLGVRLTFLTVTLVWLGWVLNGQLSVVQVVAFLQSLLTGFRWETFLIEPVIFTLWAGVAMGMLFWGRGCFAAGCARSVPCRN